MIRSKNIDWYRHLSFAAVGGFFAAYAVLLRMGVMANAQTLNLLELLRSQPQLRTALLGLNMAVDVDMMLKAIDGDISIVVPKLDLKNPDVLLMATLSNTEFLGNADDWDNVTKISPSDFIAAYEGTQTYFGVKNGLLYVATSQQMASQAALQTVGAMDIPSGKFLYASLNAGQIIKSYPGLTMMLSVMPQVRDAVEAIDGVTISADAQQNFDLRLARELHQLFNSLGLTSCVKCLINVTCTETSVYCINENCFLLACSCLLRSDFLRSGFLRGCLCGSTLCSFSFYHNLVKLLNLNKNYIFIH